MPAVGQFLEETVKVLDATGQETGGEPAAAKIKKLWLR